MSSKEYSTDNLLKGSVNPVKDYNYKIVVLEKYKLAQSFLTDVANYNFPPHMVASCYFSVKMLAGMILPYCNNVSNESVGKIYDLFDNYLEPKIDDLDTYSFIELVQFVNQCANVINFLTPLLAYIGISNKMITVGEFKYPGASTPNKPVADIVDDEQEYDEDSLEEDDE